MPSWGRNAETLKSARQTIGAQAIAIQADLSSVASAQRLASEIKDAYGQIDVVFANAGTGALASVNDATEALWDQIMNVNLKGMYFAVQQLIPLIRDGGAIVLCSSIGAVRTLPHSSIYSASKAAINALGRAFAAELMPRQIRVNVIMPGGTDTPILERSFPPDVSRAVKKQMADHTPMGRLGRPDEIAAAALFLASGDASYITATELIVDGGVVGCAS